MKRKWFRVSVDRTTVYRVRATSEEEACGNFDDDDEVDDHTTDIRTELDDDQASGPVAAKECAKHDYDRPENGVRICMNCGHQKEAK